VLEGAEGGDAPLAPGLLVGLGREARRTTFGTAFIASVRACTKVILES